MFDEITKIICSNTRRSGRWYTREKLHKNNHEHMKQENDFHNYEQAKGPVPRACKTHATPNPCRSPLSLARRRKRPISSSLSLSHGACAAPGRRSPNHRAPPHKRPISSPPVSAWPPYTDVWIETISGQFRNSSDIPWGEAFSFHLSQSFIRFSRIFCEEACWLHKTWAI
jgi:hypothetical protein